MCRRCNTYVVKFKENGSVPSQGRAIDKMRKHECECKKSKKVKKSQRKVKEESRNVKEISKKSQEKSKKGNASEKHEK